MPRVGNIALILKFAMMFAIASGAWLGDHREIRAIVQDAAPSDEQEPAPPADPPKPEVKPPTTLDKTPFEKTVGNSLPLPARRIESARELLKTYGIDDSQLDNFYNDQPVSPAEEEVLFRILFRLRQIGLASFDRWREKNVGWEKLAAEPDRERAKIFQVNGRVKQVVRKPVLAEVAEVLEYDHYFEVSMVLDDSQYTASICARAVPEAWKPNVPLDERASCQGLFLKLGPSAEGKPQFVFAARRVEWHPDRAGELGVTEDLQWLGEQGVDIGSFDAPRSRNQKPIGGSEGECFYGLLGALGRASSSELHALAKHSFDLGPLLQNAKSHHGDIVMFRGTARRVQKIMLGDEDRDFRERFGVEHYYQVDAFIPLGDKQVQFSRGPNDSNGPIFTNTFLVTLCVLKVPPELEEGKSIEVDVRLPVVFYKIWEFPSDYVKKFGDWTMQPAPMLLGVQPEVVPDQPVPSSNVVFSAGVGIVVVVALIGVWFGLWQFSRGDKEFRKKAAEIQAGREGPGKPLDFGNVVVEDDAKKR